MFQWVDGFRFTPPILELELNILDPGIRRGDETYNDLASCIVQLSPTNCFRIRSLSTSHQNKADRGATKSRSETYF